ncbi:MFS transporter [Caulobacter hibisci]|uniref:MFS transporter n=1 Tax=Caulobacter hibisci TaxID=2035993 RepID=A0ABS0SWV0_9CAUL|nr:MFS transporter [Caulobacter hibisci]MBI1684086.1 MFS transporter [Caulobacter hibisci]
MNAGRRPGTAQGVALLAATVLPIMGVVSLAPVLPRLLEVFGDQPNVHILVPVALTAPGLCIALLSPVAGVLTDWLGRRTLLLAGLGLYLVCGLLPFFLSTLPQLIASRVGLGVAEAIIMTGTTTLMSDYFTDGERQRWVAIQGGLGSLAGSVLFVAGGALGAIGWRWPFALYGLALPIMIAVAAVIWEPKRRQVLDVARDAAKAPFPGRAMAVLALTTVLCAVVFYLAVIQLGLVLQGIGVTSPATIGAVTALGSLGVPIGAFVYSRLGRWSLGKLLALALVCTGAGLVGLGFSKSVPAVFAATALNQFGCGILLPTLILWAMNTASLRWRGRVIGLWNGSFFIGQFLSPVSAALIAKGAGLPTTLALFGGLTVLGAILAFALGRRTVMVGAHPKPI